MFPECIFLHEITLRPMQGFIIYTDFKRMKTIGLSAGQRNVYKIENIVGNCDKDGSLRCCSSTTFHCTKSTESANQDID